MSKRKRDGVRDKGITLRLEQSELDLLQFISDSLEVSRTDAIMYSMKYVERVAKRRYKRDGGYTGMRYKTMEELEAAKEAELEEWREETRKQEYEILENEINESLDEFENERQIERYIEEQKEKIEEYIEEKEVDVKEQIDYKYVDYEEEIEGAREELKEYIHSLIFN